MGKQSAVPFKITSAYFLFYVAYTGLPATDILCSNKLCLRILVMIESTLATRLGVARQRAGMTQVMLAKLLGLGAGSRISDWESGRTAPTASTLVQIPRVLGVNGHWLLTGVGPMAIASGNEEAQIEAASKILSGEVSDEVVNMIAGRTDPGPVAHDAAQTVEVARTLDASPGTAAKNPAPSPDLGSRSSLKDPTVHD